MARDVTIRYVGDSRSAERAARNVAQANDRMSAKFAGVTTAMKRVRQTALLATGAVGVVAIKFGVDAVKAASSLEESWNKVSVIFGENRTEILKWATDSAKGFGLSRQAAFDAAGSFGNMFSQLGIGLPQTTRMSKAMVELAADFASFHNADIEDVIIAQTAAFRGEYDALQRFVPTINAAAVEQKALATTGKESNKELTAGEKAAATYALMMEGAGEAVGDFDRTSDGAANKMRILKAQFADVSAVVGTALMPILVSFGDWLSETGVPKIQQLSGWIRDEFVPALSDIGTWIDKNVLPPLQTMWRVFSEDIVPVFQDVAGFINDRMVPAFNALRDSITGSNEEAKKSGPSWAGWAVALGAVAVGLSAVAAVLAPLTGALKVVAVAFGFMGFAATTAFNIIMRTLPFAHIAALAFLFRDQITGAFTFIKNTLVEAWDALTAFLRSKWSESLEGIKRGWGETWAALWSGLQAGWAPIGSFFSGLPGRFKSYFDSASSWLVLGGKNIMRGLSKGIKEVWSGIVDWFRDLPGKVLSALGIKSPPKWAIEAGKWILKGITKGLGLGVGSVWTFMGKLAGGFTGTLKDAWNSLADFFMGGDAGRGGFGGLVDWFGAIVAKIINQSGGQIWLVSGYRNRAKQEQLYAQYAARGFTGAPVARPGSSYHEKGLAADFGGNMALLSQLARAAGLIAPVRGEPWHWQPAGTSGGKSYYASGGVVPRGTDTVSAMLTPGEMILNRHQQAKLFELLAARGVLTDGLVRLGEVTNAEWKTLLALGWQGKAGDNMEALYPPMKKLASVLKDANLSRTGPGGVKRTWDYFWSGGRAYAHIFRTGEVIPLGLRREDEAYEYLRRIHKLHRGGIVPGAPGSEVLAVLQAGERVIPASRGGGGGGTVVHVHVAGSVIAERELVGVINRQLDRGARIGRNGRSSL